MINELENYQHRIENLRGQIRDIIDDLPAEALNWRPLENSDDHAINSLAVLATHVTGAEHFWISEVIGRRPPTRNRDAEFVTEASDAAQLIKRLDDVAEETAQIFTALSEVDLGDTRQNRDKKISVRWALLHVVDHYALHLGHIQITYQLWNGGQGTQSPRWFQRLPENKD
jgi:uncharacterized damage-inducible protein DinB